VGMGIKCAGMGGDGKIFGTHAIIRKYNLVLAKRAAMPCG